MAATQLLQMAKDGDLTAIESRCLEALTGGQVGLAELVPTFQALEGSKEGARVATIGQMVLENSDSNSAPDAALVIARVALIGDPANADLRKRCAQLYRAVYGDTPGFSTLLDASGLESDRPARNAIRLLELCLSVKKGDPLISRTEDVVVEVVDVDAEGGLYTVRREGRPRTVTSLELAREYERVGAEDFRVLRQLRPTKLAEMIQTNPVQVVIGLIRAHGDQIDQDTLKSELSPRFISERDWSKWWTDARALLKRDPHVVVEGRSPVILSYSKSALTAESETWKAFSVANDPHKWLSIVEGYLRDKKKDRSTPDAELLARCHSHLMNYIKSIEKRRPAEALACALVTERLDRETGQSDEESRELAIRMLRETDNPVALIAKLEDNSLWDLGLEALQAARTDDLASSAVALIPLAASAQLDTLIKMARKGELMAGVQAHIDAGLIEPVDFPEIIYWLWKGSAQTEGLQIPNRTEQFTLIVRVLNELGRKLHKPIEAMKRFRARMKSALQLKDFAQVRQCMQETPPDRAITLKRQLQWLDGLGDNTPSRMLEMLREVHPELWKVTERRTELWEDPNVLWTTRGGIQRKVEERDHLINVTMRENAKRIGEAASLGDLSENSEYKFALEERDLLRARLAQMNNELSLAQPIDPRDVPTDLVGIGSKVTLRNVEDGATRSFTFLGPFDGDLDHDIYNYKAPVSQKLMGLHVGEHAKVTLDGKESEFEVVSIENGLA